MKRIEQYKMNCECVSMKKEMEVHMNLEYPNGLSNSQGRKLRNCQAKVYELKCYYVLQSYETIVACIDKETGELADFSRLVYGYTATTSQHISKFFNDYSQHTINPNLRYTWRCL